MEVQECIKKILLKSKDFQLKKHGVIIVFFFLGLIISLMVPGFISLQNILNIFLQSSIIGIMSIGTTFVIMGGGFDISVGSLLAFTTSILLTLQNIIPWPIAILVVLFIGASIGFINGLITTKLHMFSIIVTLGTMIILRGLTFMYTGGYQIIGNSKSFAFIGRGRISIIPVPIIVWIVLVIFWQYVLRKTVFGRYCCAIGSNRESSRLSGIKVDFYGIMTFVIGGLMASMSGVVYAARLNAVTPLAGQGYELEAIAATVIGGTSVSGGEGSVIGTVIGVLLLGIIDNVSTLLGLQVYIQYLVEGIFILAVVGFDSYSKYNR